MLLAGLKRPTKENTYCLSKAHTFFLGLCFGIWVALPVASFAALPEPLPASLITQDHANPSTLPGNTPEYVIVKPVEQVTFSSETAASIANLPVFEGTRFKAGDVLLKMDCRLQQAELEKTEAQAEAAGMSEKSAYKLKSYGSISELEVVKAHSDALIARAEVDKLKALVDKCVIIAPFNGAVAEVMVHPLETVKPGDPLLKIVNTENLEIEIQVPSAWLKWLKINSVFDVHINETNKTEKVTVARIDPEIESVSETIKIIGIVTTPDPTLLPGMTGQASFPDNPDGPKKPSGK